MTHSIGIIGSGNISGAYLKIAQELGLFRVAAITDLDLGRAQAQASAHGSRAVELGELLADPEIVAVVNLTPPGAHAATSLAILNAGKHVYSEKPLAVTRADGQAILTAARARGLRVGCAPDTVLGAGLQTARELLDAGRIGRPVAATAFMLGAGPEGWHPDPGFFYQPGAGPLFDMGPYYLTALVNLLGSVGSVGGSAVSAHAERVIGSGARQGQRVPVRTPTHVTAQLTFAASEASEDAGGPVATFIASFDVQASELPRTEIYGTEGTLSLPDPNTFGGPLRIRRTGERDWETIELTRPFQDNARGIGLADLLAAVDHSTPHRASGELAYHVLDVMQTVLDAAEAGRTLPVDSRAERPAPLDPRPEWLPAGLG
ncbi:Gfo/Idh/MocA family protein [Deinococcus radiopugnans]|uniref:Dehydrogenase n=1 Tax=Deinococcus radiopugnans ATCC 19172 TaxID=585398 RepID=A0A5C4YBW4_9DEIO|nr:Gfo/Idh/MocA family oxidoreductase [Deinococcus radiopugnans]MBB6015171.1 putative dehydrogenase [Deinococcus radiopugnans ATCC 19172]TNM73121.1 Gfo/Idh/MocA family oxidoreductase [Deinococcus radiopugnans ATCC 19172]